MESEVLQPFLPEKPALEGAPGILSPALQQQPQRGVTPRVRFGHTLSPSAKHIEANVLRISTYECEQKHKS